MSRARKPYPVVDVFAGPGGLGEGFASLIGESGKRQFQGVVAIERDQSSHQTLLLRHFLQGFPEGEFPDEYYRYLNGDIAIDELYAAYKVEFAEAKRTALKISLGPELRLWVRKIIGDRLSGRKRWALVGGPPCQAYSLVGRSRMMGRADFEKDERHFLYLEYLKIIADHAPPVFVMENVKGLLSAKIGGGSVIDRILGDLAHPAAALKSARSDLSYRLYSLTEQEMPRDAVDPRLFLVHAEDYGVPQARHRMFIVGVRSDIDIRPRLLRPHKAPTVAETIGNLPAIRSGLSRGTDSVERWSREIERLSSIDIARQLNGASYTKAVASGISIELSSSDDLPAFRSSRTYPGRIPGRFRALSTLYDARLRALTGHELRGHMPSDLRRYMYAAVFARVTGRSPKLADFPRDLLPAHQNVALGTSGKMFSDRFRVQLPDDVSTTITSHISKDGHYCVSACNFDPVSG